MRDGTRGQERLTGTSFVISKLFLLPSSSHSFFSPVTSFLQSTTIGGAGWGVSDAGGTTYCSRPPREFGGGNGCVFRYFLSSILLDSSSLHLTVFIIRLFLFFVRNNKGRTGPTRSAIETLTGHDGDGGRQRVHVILYFCSLICFLLLAFLLFQLSTVR